MGREVRMVPEGWEHPSEFIYGRFQHVPLLEGSWYAESKKEFDDMVVAEGMEATLEYFEEEPDQDDYMPDWPAEECTHLMMYQTTSEGTPISPAFATPEELARWLTDNDASSFGSFTATYEQWLATARSGWAPSAIVDGGVLKSGVEALAKTE